MKPRRLDRIARIFFVLLFSVGLALALFPIVGSLLFDQQNSRATVAYASFAEDEQNAQQLANIQVAAHSYNETLLEYAQTTGSSGIQGVNTTVFPGLSEQAYQETLNADGSGVMGTVSVPSIGVELPIYHGTSTEALSRGAGHLEGTSLPVGGMGTHSVITGHSGLITQRMLTDLEQVQVGEHFYIKTGGETLTYEVNQIHSIDPYDISDLGIDSSHDYVTLMTCTPYGLNTERLVVRGERVAGDLEAIESLPDGSVPTLAEEWIDVYIGAVTLLLAIGMVVVLIVLQRHFVRKRHRFVSRTKEGTIHE